MKKKCFQSAALVLGMLTVSSQMLKAETVVLLEDFESYSNNSQMTAVWNLLPIGTFNNLDTTVGNNGNSLRMNSPDINGLGRLIRNLPGGPITADATTNIVMSVDMLLDDLEHRVGTERVTFAKFEAMQMERTTTVNCRSWLRWVSLIRRPTLSAHFFIKAGSRSLAESIGKRLMAKRVQLVAQ